MRTKIVSSKDLSSKSLLASDYVPNPRKAAKLVVDEWARQHTMLRRGSEALLELELLIAAAIRAERKKA